MRYDERTLIRFVLHALLLLFLVLGVFGFVIELFDLEPTTGAVIRLALFSDQGVPAKIVLGSWLLEAAGLLALFLLAQGRCGAWWIDGLVAGWAAWIFRAPLLVITVVVVTGQSQRAWWTLAFAWWVLYTCCGLMLAILARRADRTPAEPAVESAPSRAEPADAEVASSTTRTPYETPVLEEPSRAD